MRNRVIALIAVGVAIITAASSVSSPVAAQSAARAAAYTPPKTRDGYPDFNGVWRVWNLAKYDLEDHGAKPGVPAGRGFVVDPPDGKIPYQEWALKKREENRAKSPTVDTRLRDYQTAPVDPYPNADPLAKCYLPGVPRITYLGWPFQIIQDTNDVNMTYEWMHKKRIIPVKDAGPRPDPNDALEGRRWNGVPRGRYDGNSLVIDSTNFNPYTWFDMAGNFHSEALHVVERYTLTGPDTIAYEARIEDPKVFTRAWTIRMPIQRQKDVGLLDYECTAMFDDLGVGHTWPRDFDGGDQ